MLQIAEHHVEGDGRACVAQMWVAINGRAADIHSNVRSVEGFEALFLSSERIIDNEF